MEESGSRRLPAKPRLPGQNSMTDNKPMVFMADKGGHECSCNTRQLCATINIGCPVIIIHLAWIESNRHDYILSQSILNFETLTGNLKS